MKSIKWIGLAAVVSMIAMAFVGASSASALSTALCKTKEKVCASGNQYAAGTTLSAKLKEGTTAKLTGALEVTCSASTVGGKTEGASLGASILGAIETLTFTSCGTTCESITAEGFPYVSHLVNLGSLKGTLTVLTPKVVLKKCTIFKITCTATAKEVVLDVDTSVEPATIKAINEPLELGACGKGTWNAEYVLTEPKPVFLEE